MKLMTLFILFSAMMATPLFSGEKDCKNIVSEYGDEHFETNEDKHFLKESLQLLIDSHLSIETTMALL